MPLFRDLPEEDLEFLMRQSSRKKFSAGKIIFAVGSPANVLFVVLSGQVKMFHGRKGMIKEETVCISSPGQYFCLAPVLSRELMHMNAKALRDSEMLVLPKAALDSMVDRSHVFSRNVIRALANKECDLCEQVCDLSLTTTKERLAKYLLESSHEQKSFRLPVLQSELASSLGTVRETLARDFSALRKARVLEKSGRNIRILSLAELKRIAGASKENGLRLLG